MVIIVQSATSCKGDKLVAFATSVFKYDRVLYELNLQWRRQPADCCCLCDNVGMHISLSVVNKNFILFDLFIHLFISIALSDSSF